MTRTNITDHIPPQVTHWEPGDVAFIDHDPEGMPGLACEYVTILSLTVETEHDGRHVPVARVRTDNGVEATVSTWRLECDPVRFLTARQKK